MTSRILSFLGVFALAAGGAPKEVPNPAAAGSGQSFLIADGAGKVYLSWVEPSGDGRHRLQFAVRDGETWRVKGPVAEGRNWFVNWADYPTFLPLPGERFAAHWLEKFAPSTYSYGLKVAQSSGSNQWRVTLAPKVAREDDYTGFVSLIALREGVGVAYLAPGERGGEEDKSLRFAKLSHDGAVISDELLDPDVCTCCQTAAALTDDGPVVAYRDHEPGEIRDIAVVALRGGKWTAPRPANRDGWRINACPVNGPALAASGRRVVLAWHTAAEGKPRAYAAFSSDGGLHFGAPLPIDDGSPIGRVAVVALPDGGAVASWIERRPEGGAEIRLRRIRQDGRRGASVVVSTVDPGRRTGFPKMVRSGRGLLLTWTADTVKTAEAEIPEL